MLQPEDMATLRDLWTAMNAFAGLRPRLPKLGYRGCHVTDNGSGDEFFAYGGVVALTAGRTTEARADVNEVFEQRVLTSAPPGMIPMELIRR